MISDAKKNIIGNLRRDVMMMEHHKPLAIDHNHVDGLAEIAAAFPGGAFPAGGIHEFLTFSGAQFAATTGFLSGLLSVITRPGGSLLWISRVRTVFPPALRQFGIRPDKIIFVTPRTETEVLWSIEEALACKALAGVIGEVRELSFTHSRRLQLAVETSLVPGFILRSDERRLCPTASTTRWLIKPLASRVEDGMPGLGFPLWQVALQKVRNGRPGNWQVEWTANRFRIIHENNKDLMRNEALVKAG